jgi:hypothetical protein
MGRLIIITLWFYHLSALSLAQSIPLEYSTNINKADSFYQLKQFENAGKYYNRAFSNRSGYSSDYHRLLAAVSWAKAHVKDSALINLYVLIYALNFSDPQTLEQLFEPTILKSNHEFLVLKERCRCQEMNTKKKYNPELAAMLDSIYRVDQYNRTMPTQGATTQVISADHYSQEKNLRFIDSLYKIHGWLTSKEVGYNGAHAQFLVIQHSALLTQKKWKPIIKKVVDLCLLAPENYALLIDRILVREGKKQLYGTQLKFDKKTNIYIPYPISSPASVDDRRFKLGMTSLKAYIEMTN